LISAYTQAHATNDLTWMRRISGKTHRLWVILAGVSLFMLCVSQPMYHLWVGNRVRVPFQLSLVVMVLTIMQNYIRIFHMVLNGVGKVKLQMYIYLVAAVVNIPISLLLALTFHMGVAGIIWGTVICQLGHVILAPIQVRKIIGGTAKGVWAA
jgi:O-antigen/teichoic acid export membrane protein